MAPRTLDQFPGTRYEEALVFDTGSQGSQLPTEVGGINYASGTVSGTGLFFNEEGSVFRFGRIIDVVGSGGVTSFVTGGVANVSIDNNIVATVSGTTFTGPLYASGGLTGSLQYVSPGVPYLVGGVGVNVATQSNGQVTISSVSTGALPPPTQMGQVLLAVTALAFVRSLPITSTGSGWLVNNFGYLLVNTSSF